MAASDGGRLEFIDPLKSYAILLVVILHVSATPLYQYNTVSHAVWWISNVVDSFARVCVPLFIMASGATLLDPKKLERLGEFFNKRVRRVVVPFLFWACVYLAFRRYLLNEPITKWQGVMQFVTGPIFYHLPFFFYLTGLYLAAPILVLFTAHADRSKAIYFTALWFLFSSVIRALSEWNGVAVAWSPYVVGDFVGYFVLGRLLSGVAIEARDLKWCALAVAAGWAATVWGTHMATLRAAGNLNEFFFVYSRPNVVVMTVATYLVAASRPMRSVFFRPYAARALIDGLSRYAFGIYLVHPLVLFVLATGWLRIQLSSSSLAPGIGIMVTTAVVMVISVGIVAVMRRVPLARAVVP